MSQLVTGCRGVWVDHSLTKMHHCSKRWPFFRVCSSGVWDDLADDSYWPTEAENRGWPKSHPYPQFHACGLLYQGDRQLALVNPQLFWKESVPHCETCFSSCELVLWIPPGSGTLMPGKHLWFKEQTQVIWPSLLIAHLSAGISFPFTAPKDFLAHSEVGKRNWLNSLLGKFAVCC